MLADEESILAKRAPFAKHDFWVTGYRDGEFWAAGEFTNQSREEKGGVGDMVARGDWFMSLEPDDEEAQGEAAQKAGPVIWSVFGFTHNPRVEDWPVMPVEIHQMHLRPADFFTSNPALDVPSARNNMSVLVPCGNGTAKQEPNVGAVQRDPLSHLQGTGPDVNPQEAGASVK
uniref:Amine oxidase n=1 Tax=Bionectria ochroleuca TaxID=29856 RepID=A0A8H7TRX9_BIOOC